MKKENNISEIDNLLSKNSVVLFDGECGFCNSSVLFLLDSNPNDIVKFASQQSDLGKKIKAKFAIASNTLDTIFVVEKGVIYQKSKAVFTVLKHLNSYWKFLAVFEIIPLFIADFIYDIIAKNRYLISGKKCRILTPQEKKRFIN